jgi:dihydrofolate synthase/folylpolyglutamate synthase
MRNAAVAVALLERFADAAGIEIPDAAWKPGFEQVHWPARLQVLRDTPPVLLDGGHNPHAARALAAALRDLAPRRPVGLIAGLVADKDVDGFFRALSPAITRAWIVPVRSDRAAPAAAVTAVARAAGIAAEENALDNAMRDAIDWAAGANGVVCIAGSLFLAGEVLAGIVGERDLYES